LLCIILGWNPASNSEGGRREEGGEVQGEGTYCLLVLSLRGTLYFSFLILAISTWNAWKALNHSNLVGDRISIVGTTSPDLTSVVTFFKGPGGDRVSALPYLRPYPSSVPL